MRRAIVVAAVALLPACQREPPSQSPAVSSTPVTGADARPNASEKGSSVDGWETSGWAYPMLGATLPDFKAQRLGGSELTQKDLRDHWTIVGFWNGSGENAKAEMRYIGELNSAADPEPDLDFISFYLPDGGDFDIRRWSSTEGAWPTGTGDAILADSFGIATVPAYLLVGPDLTIEAYRGPLKESPADGIKSVVRGVAQ